MHILLDKVWFVLPRNKASARQQIHVALTIPDCTALPIIPALKGLLWWWWPSLALYTAPGNVNGSNTRNQSPTLACDISNKMKLSTYRMSNRPEVFSNTKHKQLHNKMRAGIKARKTTSNIAIVASDPMLRQSRWKIYSVYSSVQKFNTVYIRNQVKPTFVPLNVGAIKIVSSSQIATCFCQTFWFGACQSRVYLLHISYYLDFSTNTSRCWPRKQIVSNQNSLQLEEGFANGMHNHFRTFVHWSFLSAPHWTAI